VFRWSDDDDDGEQIAFNVAYSHMTEGNVTVKAESHSEFLQQSVNRYTHGRILPYIMIIYCYVVPGLLCYLHLPIWQTE